MKTTVSETSSNDIQKTTFAIFMMEGKYRHINLERRRAKKHTVIDSNYDLGVGPEKALYKPIFFVSEAFQQMISVVINVLEQFAANSLQHSSAS